MPMNPMRPISASNGRGISPAASQARTWGAIFSRAKARAIDDEAPSTSHVRPLGSVKLDGGRLPVGSEGVAKPVDSCSVGIEFALNWMV